MRDVAAPPAGQGVGLVFGDRGPDDRQFGDLMANRVQAGRPPARAQVGPTPLALGREVDDGVVDPFGRGELSEVGRVALLPVGPAAGLRLDGRRGRAGRVGQGRQGRVAGVGLEPGLDFAQAGVERGHPLPQGRDDRVSLTTAWALGLAHDRDL